MLAGLDDEQGLASSLGISRHTVHTHIERLYRKLRVNSRSQLIAAVFVAYATHAHGNGER
jgi:DNA-binding CsgD family transcriptional regulator